MSNELVFKVYMPIFCIIFGAIVSYIFNYFSNIRKINVSNAIKLYEEFHSESMLECRLKALKVLDENLDKKNIEDIYKSDVDDYIYVSRLLHWFEKVEVYEKNNLVDSDKIASLLGRYFRIWHDRYYKKLTNKLEDNSEFTPMMNSFKYVSEKMGSN